MTSERQPAILAVDDGPAVLAAVARDLRRGFGERYRILRAGSGAEALDLLRQTRTRGDQVALLIADQRMPGMPGTEYLVEARTVVPDAKRVLLTAYADTEAAIAAINEVALDYYLLKPWDPPDEQLFPVVEDGTVLERPTVLEIAERLGVAGRPAAEHYDLVIVGGGPAGLAAAVYGASEGLKTVLVEREAPGGQAGQSSRIENYLGFPYGLSGSDLARRATTQARRLGAELVTVQDAVALRAEGAGRVVALSGGGELSANCVLVASGVSYRQLDTPGFAELTGAGVYYGAALAEARSCADQTVAVIGGADSAGFGGCASEGPAERGPPWRSTRASYSSEPRRARTGSRALSPATSAGSSSPDP